MTITTLNALKQHLPDFSAIKIDDVPLLIKKIITDNQRILTSLLATKEHTWDDLLRPLEKMADDLSRVWAPIQHLHSVQNNKNLRKVYDDCLVMLTTYEIELAQNKQLYQAFLAISESPGYQQLTPDQQKIITNHLRDFKLSGIHLSAKTRDEIKEIDQKLSQYYTQFNNNLLDATEAWHYHTNNEQEIAGIPSHIIRNAQQSDPQGWTFGLDCPTYQGVITYAKDPQLRQHIYQAYQSRASELTPAYDNSSTIKEILSLRHELATLLNYPDYSHYSLVTKMAKSPQEILEFLTTLAHHAKPYALEEIHTLQTFAKEKEGVTHLEPWSIAYYSEQLKQQQFGINEEELRAYFPVDQVLKGLFHVLKRLFAIHFEERKMSTWHEEVRFFTLYDENQQPVGHLYCDLFARKGKRDGAWMDECRQRHYLTPHEIELPVAFLTCNFASSSNSCGLKHGDIVTLFHEMGHCLHHLLTTINYSDISGINGVPWDVVEFPSQLLEHWCWQPQVLSLLSCEQKSLPEDLITKMIASHHFQTGLATLRQVIFSIFDMTLHSQAFMTNPKDVVKLYNEINEEYGVITLPSFNRFPHSFAHIFSGGYAAGYYSYKWAEVMACDAFTFFDPIFDQQVGKKLQNCILSQGGAKDMMDLYVQFRGRPPKIEALLRHSGFIQ